MQSLEEEYRKIKDYDFDFENIAFEGGGVKMASYIGVVKVLETMGVLKKCKRFAGTSGGSLVAMMLAINETSEQVKDFMMRVPVSDLVGDSMLGPLALVPNMMRRYGWNPAERYHQAIRKELKMRTGNPDITFGEVYKRYGNELCIVCTNVSSMCVEYFHPKTTPDCTLATAVRASSALPGYIQPVQCKTCTGTTSYLTDGGLVCNFPLHVFDGWFLSMNPDDTFFNKLGRNEAQFSTFNPKTIGFLLYTPWEGEFMQGELHSRYRHTDIKRPRTPLAKKRGARCDRILQQNEERQKLMDAAKRFLELLREMDVNRDSEIELHEFKNAFDKIDEEAKEVLFGKDFNFGTAFLEIDKDSNGKITFQEFTMFLIKKGIHFRALLEGGNMMEIHSFGQFFEVTLSTVLNMSRKAFLKEDDIDRTAGIYTDYVDTSDFDLRQADKRFLTNQGINCTILYFQDILRKHKAGTLPESMKNCVTEKLIKPKKVHGVLDIDLTVPEQEMNDDLKEDSVDGGKNGVIPHHVVQVNPEREEDSDWLDQLQYESIEKESHKCVVWSAILSGTLTFIVCAAIFMYLLIYMRNEMLLNN